ncbi:TPA: hypothetical protein H1940_004771 [Salmonella enterica]|nr:hypothetical protein [Salmonella enterica]
MGEIRIAASTGEIDKRTINGNNGVRRGKDRKRRAPASGYLVLKDEVKAGLRARLDEVIKAYGGCAALSREIGVCPRTIWAWKKRGMISVKGAQLIQKDYRRKGFNGFRAPYCRPDIKFDNNGKPLENRCSNRRLMRFVTKEEAEARGHVRPYNPLRAMSPEEREKEKARRKAERDKAKEERRKAKKANQKKRIVIFIDGTDC